MNKAIKKFIIYAMISVFILLTVLLSIINGINFTLAANDADRITKNLSERHGSFDAFKPGEQGETATTPSPDMQQEEFGGMPIFNRGPMGPSSPELELSLGYFTYSFDKNGNGKEIAFSLSEETVSHEGAEAWAASLIGGDSTGWTKTTYRYRVYSLGGKTFVTVIDQGRELGPSFRILVISLIGEALGLLISLCVLIIAAKRLFSPIDEADRKQKRFIFDIERRFKIPLTIVSANTELIERESGSSEYTQSINRQVKKMALLVKDLSALSVFDESDADLSTVDLSETLSETVDSFKEKFVKAGIELTVDIESGIKIKGDKEALGKMMSEIVENALKFGVSQISFSLKKENERISLEASNGTTLPNGGVEQVFDRFTRLENADGVPGSGLGLSYVKNVAKACGGRVYADVDGGKYTLKIHF